jgi:hypothetical protein
MMSGSAMTPEKIRFAASRSAGAMVIIFALNYFVLSTGLSQAMMWALGLGAVVFAMAWRHAQS